MKSFAKPLQRVLLPEIKAPENPKASGSKKIEPVATTELTAEEQALRDAFIADRKREAQQRLDNTDSEFWFCIGFKSREQKDEFLRKSGLIAEGDKYINGEALAKLMGIELETPDPKFHSKFSSNKQLLKYARPLRGK